MTEQPLISWHGEDAGVEFKGRYLHPSRCDCEACKSERLEKLQYRREMRRVRCEADDAAVQANIELYRSRYEQGLALWEDVEVFETV